MGSPGESLRQEREARGRTIEEMAEATGIRLQFLTALEQESFDSLPGRGFCKLYIRAYAEVLGFDPRPVIEAYDCAFRARLDAAPTPASENAPRPIQVLLAHWRQERMAARAEADLSEESPEHPEDVEQEPEPEDIEEPAVVEAPAEAAPAPGIVEGAAESEPVMVVQAISPGEFIEGVRSLPLRAEAVSPARPVRSRRLLASLLLLALLPLMAYLLSLRSTPDAPPVAARHETVTAEAIAPPPSPSARVTEAPRTQPPVSEQSAPPSLRVTESGLGLRFVGTRVEAEGDRFRSGQRVTFAMRVLGGTAGESISHVWLRDGRVEQSIRLRLGGASWRTHSTKTLGRPGAWAVEARDEQGRVLARADLTVEP